MQNGSRKPADLGVVLSRLKTFHLDADSIADVVAFGERAIPALRIILFAREPDGFHQVRCRAAEALSLLGAHDILEEFLRIPRRGDAVERLGDDVVMSAAARAIAHRKDAKTFAFLSELATTHPLNGIIAGLASFGLADAIPILIDALDEDEVRVAAEAALISFGPGARPYLLDAAQKFKSVNDPSQSQLRKCRSILLLLGEIVLDPSDAERIRSFMTSNDVQTSLLACRVALRSTFKPAQSDARARLTYLRSRASWLERLQIDQYLDSPTDQ